MIQTTELPNHKGFLFDVEETECGQCGKTFYELSDYLLDECHFCKASIDPTDCNTKAIRSHSVTLNHETGELVIWQLFIEGKGGQEYRLTEGSQAATERSDVR